MTLSKFLTCFRRWNYTFQGKVKSRPSVINYFNDVVVRAKGFCRPLSRIPARLFEYLFGNKMVVFRGGENHDIVTWGYKSNEAGWERNKKTRKMQPLIIFPDKLVVAVTFLHDHTNLVCTVRVCVCVYILKEPSEKRQYTIARRVGVWQEVHTKVVLD